MRFDLSHGSGNAWVMRFTLRLLALLLLGLGGPLRAAPPPLTILVSLDGFRPDYLGQGRTPNLDRIAAAGVRATMRPSFPTLTFPNHHAIATGLRPDRNGIVENKMRDSARAAAPFDNKDSKTKTDPFWWEQSEPIWIAAERAGLRTAAVFWPGTDVAIRGVRPSAWLPFDAAVTSAQRVDFVLDWARRPAATRPRLIALYFDAVDKASHAEGITSAHNLAAIAELDGAVGRLAAGLKALHRPANLVIVSDHGMEDIPPAHVLPLGTVVDRTIMDVVTPGGPIVSVWPKPGHDAEVAAKLLRPHPHLHCWRREDLPARFHYGRNPRVPPFYCLVTDTGWRYSDDPPKDHPVGDHGYDPADPQMTALFLATGPAFRGPAVLPEFDNVDVYALLRDLLGLSPARNVDGTDMVFREILKP